LLKKKRYEHHQWNICADLQVVAMLIGLQGGYTKFFVAFYVKGTAERGTGITVESDGHSEEKRF
jgi:hypothetical protein